MANEPAVPAAPAPAPVTPVPAAPAAPVTPPLPKAQEQSLPPSVKNPPQTKPQKPMAGDSLESKMRKLSSEVLRDSPENAQGPQGEAPAKPAEVPAPKPEEKPAAPAAKEPFDGMDLPEGASEAQKTNFKTMKAAAAAEVNRLKNEQAAMAKELETYKKATPADTAEAERLRTELKAAQDRLAVFDVSSHPDFQRQFVEPKKKALAAAKMLLTDNAVEGAPDIAALLDKPRPEFSKALTEAAAKLPLFDQADFMQNAREAYRLHGEEKGQLQNAAQLREQLRAKAAQESRQAFEASRGEFTTRVPVLTVPENATKEQIEQINEYNTAREAAIKEAEALTFGQMSERQVADVATRAAALNMVSHHVIPNLQKRLAEATKIIEAQNAELEGIRSRKNPGSFAGTETPAAAEPKSIRELTQKMFPGPR